MGVSIYCRDFWGILARWPSRPFSQFSRFCFCEQYLCFYTCNFLTCCSPALLIPSSSPVPAHFLPWSALLCSALLLYCSCFCPALALLLLCSYPAPALLLPCSCPTPALFLPCFCPASARLLPCSWSYPPQIGSHHHHLTTFFGKARADFYGTIIVYIYNP